MTFGKQTLSVKGDAGFVRELTEVFVFKKRKRVTALEIHYCFIRFHVFSKELIQAELKSGFTKIDFVDKLVVKLALGRLI